MNFDRILAALFVSGFMGSIFISAITFVIAMTDVIFGTIFWQTIFDFFFYEDQNVLIRLLILLFLAVSTGTLGGKMFPHIFGDPWSSKEYEE